MELKLPRRYLQMTLNLSLLLGFAVAGTALAAGGYHLQRQIALGGEGGWDYLTFDAASGHLFVTHASRTLVIDPSTDKILGEIPGNGVHGVAIAADLDRGFISNGRNATVTIFDLKTLKPIGQFPTGENPDAILYESSSHRVFTFNGKSGDATVFDALSAKVLATIPLGGKPEFAAEDGQGHVYVNIEDTNELVRLDVGTLKVTQRYSLSPCTEPTGLAMDTAHRRLFAACSNKMMAVVDADSGKVITTIPTGDGTDAAAFDTNTGLIFTSNGEGTLSVIHQDTRDRYSVVETVPTAQGARMMALDPKTHEVYLATAQFGAAPLPTTEQPYPRKSIVPDTFSLLVFGR